MRLLSFGLIAILFFSACEVSEEVVISQNMLNIAYAEALTNFSPLSYEASTRKYLVNFYEPLLSYDKSFNTKTGLAVSWGRIDDRTWDFRLREGVLFHDGSGFDAVDVVYSLNLYRDDPDSELGALLNSIESVSQVDQYRVQVTTTSPDPLLLNKLTNVYIIPDGYSDFESPIGTGPFSVTEILSDDVVLQRFDDYWGPAPYFQDVHLKYIPDTNSRLDAILSADVQMLANVPPQFVNELKEGGIDLTDFPSLEVSFLMFNLDGVFANPDIRSAVWYALKTDYAEVLGGGYLIPSSQFAASGISGYVAGLDERERNLDLAMDFRAKSSGGIFVTLDVPYGLEILGEKVAQELSVIDINVEINSLPLDEFERKIFSNESDFYFFGWKYDLADSVDFFESVIHTTDENYGTFNGMAYSNEILDQLTEESATILDVGDRRLLLNEMTEILLEDHIVMPLFESKLLYGIHPSIVWDIRLDGQILASEIIENVVK